MDVFVAIVAVDVAIVGSNVSNYHLLPPWLHLPVANVKPRLRPVLFVLVSVDRSATFLARAHRRGNGHVVLL